MYAVDGTNSRLHVLELRAAESPTQASPGATNAESTVKRAVSGTTVQASDAAVVSLAPRSGAAMAGVALGGVSPAAAVSDTLPATHYMVALPQPLSTAGRQPSAMPWFSASDGAAGASGASVSGAVTEVGGDSAGGGYSAEVANGTLACAALDVAVLREQLLRLCGSRPPAVESSGKEGPHGARHDGGGTSEGEGYFEGGGIGGSGRRYGPGSGEVETGDEVGAKCGSAAQRASLSALHALSLQEVISLELEVRASHCCPGPPSAPMPPMPPRLRAEPAGCCRWQARYCASRLDGSSWRRRTTVRGRAQGSASSVGIVIAPSPSPPVATWRAASCARMRCLAALCASRQWSNAFASSSDDMHILCHIAIVLSAVQSAVCGTVWRFFASAMRGAPRREASLFGCGSPV